MISNRNTLAGRNRRQVIKNLGRHMSVPLPAAHQNGRAQTGSNSALKVMEGEICDDNLGCTIIARQAGEHVELLCHRPIHDMPQSFKGLSR